MINPSENEKLFDFLAQNIFVMLGQIDKIIEEDYEIAESYIKIFAEFGIKSSRPFISGYNETIQNYVIKMIEFTRLK